MISRRPPPIETVGGDTRATGPYVITDGVRMLEVFHVQDMAYELGEPSYRQGNHRADMLMAYLPKEKILLNADLYGPPAPGAAPPAATDGQRAFVRPPGRRPPPPPPRRTACGRSIATWSS